MSNGWCTLWTMQRCEIYSRNDWTEVRKGILIQPLSFLKSLNNPFQSLSIVCCISSHLQCFGVACVTLIFAVFCFSFVTLRRIIKLFWNSEMRFPSPGLRIIMSPSASSNGEPLLDPELNWACWTKRSPRLDLTSLSESPRYWRVRLRRDLALVLADARLGGLERFDSFFLSSADLLPVILENSPNKGRLKGAL